MSASDKAKHNMQDAKGKTKKVIGHATDDKEMQAEGDAEQGSAKFKKLMDRARDVVRQRGRR